MVGELMVISLGQHGHPSAWQAAEQSHLAARLAMLPVGLYGPSRQNWATMLCRAARSVQIMNNDQLVVGYNCSMLGKIKMIKITK